MTGDWQRQYRFTIKESAELRVADRFVDTVHKADAAIRLRKSGHPYVAILAGDDRAEAFMARRWCGIVVAQLLLKIRDGADIAPAQR